jgi:thiol-disulfide isomerase/thioredoxin
MSDGQPISRWAPIRSIAHRLAGDAVELPVEGELASFEGATGWLGSEPLTPAGMRGRVVLVDFWTYTCVNWLRTVPYVRAWASKYAPAGLTVIGVHTPEFGFEHELENVVLHARRLGVDYPVAIDSDYRVWRAFGNHYWPAVYLADAEGRIRFHHFGEGEYAMTEMAIQRLLVDAGAAGLDEELVTVEPRGLEVAADWGTLRSPETYLGYAQSTGFASPDPVWDERHSYVVPSTLGLNEWAVSGRWTLAGHAAVAHEPGCRIAVRFHARDVNLVMGPVTKGPAIPFKVSLDGRPAEDALGTDVPAGTEGVVTTQRTYQLVRQVGPITDRTLEIEFLEGGIEAYCLTFG